MGPGGVTVETLPSLPQELRRFQDGWNASACPKNFEPMLKCEYRVYCTYGSGELSAVGCMR